MRYRTIGGSVVEGRVPLDKRILEEIHKDVLWRREGAKRGINRIVQWEFAGAPPSEQLSAMLARWQINIVYH